MSQSQGEAAIRRAGAVVALAAASALMAMGFPAVEARAHVVLALYAILLLGCAAVLLSPVHGAVADLARRAAEAARGTAADGASWLRFAGIVLYTLYTLYVAAWNKSAAEAEAEAEAEAAWPDTARDFLLFLMFLAGVWTVYFSMIREMGGPPATAADEASLDGAGVWAVYQPVVVAMDAGKGGQPIAAAGEDHDGGGAVNGAVAPARDVVDSKL